MFESYFGRMVSFFLQDSCKTQRKCIRMYKYNIKNIRPNFSIIAHMDHSKWASQAPSLSSLTPSLHATCRNTSSMIWISNETRRHDQEARGVSECITKRKWNDLSIQPHRQPGSHRFSVRSISFPLATYEALLVVDVGQGVARPTLANVHLAFNHKLRDHPHHQQG